MRDWNDWLFDAFMYPLEAMALRSRRRSLVAQARGKVLEIGAGTGANLRFYRWDRMRELHLLDLELSGALRSQGALHGVPVVVHQGDVQSLPFGEGTFDVVVSTLVFCSVEDQARGLSEVRRVLAPGGLLLFIEHVRPDGPALRRAVDAVDPLWHAMNGRCRLNRQTLAAIREAGFALRSVHRGGGGLLIDGVAMRAGWNARLTSRFPRPTGGD